MRAKWFAPALAYTMAKYGMSMCVLGMAEEFRGDGIAVNALWPRTIIATVALQIIPGAEPDRGRTPEIMADAAWQILTRTAAPPPVTSLSTRTCCVPPASQTSHITRYLRVKSCGRTFSWIEGQFGSTQNGICRVK